MTKKDKNTSPETTDLNIYQKIYAIQSEIKELVRSEENKFQKYKFFNELQVLQLLRPLLDKYHLTILFSDEESKEFSCEQTGSMYLVKYQKKCLLVNSENPTENLTHYFWALGQNNDPAKAKGSAETYGIKYFLSKFFLIPVKDETDPDYHPREESSTSSQPTRSRVTINSSQIDYLLNLLRQKAGRDKKLQTDFFAEVDVLLKPLGTTDTTTAINLQERCGKLTSPDYVTLVNWLNGLGK